MSFNADTFCWHGTEQHIELTKSLQQPHKEDTQQPFQWKSYSVQTYDIYNWETDKPYSWWYRFVVDNCDHVCWGWTRKHRPSSWIWSKGRLHINQSVHTNAGCQTCSWSVAFVLKEIINSWPRECQSIEAGFQLHHTQHSSAWDTCPAQPSHRPRWCSSPQQGNSACRAALSIRLFH